MEHKVAYGRAAWGALSEAVASSALSRTHAHGPSIIWYLYTARHTSDARAVPLPDAPRRATAASMAMGHRRRQRQGTSVPGRAGSVAFCKAGITQHYMKLEQSNIIYICINLAYNNMICCSFAFISYCNDTIGNTEGKA